MKRVLYSVCIGSLALALTAGAEQVKDRRPDRAKAQQRTANVHAARPANTGAMMGARHSAAVNRQRTYTAARSNSNAAMSQNRMRAVRERNLARNQEFRARSNVAAKAARPASATPATVRDRNFAVNRSRNDVNRYRNMNESRARNSVAVNRERNLAGNRTKTAEVNRVRKANEFRARNGVAVNPKRNFNQTRNFAYYRGGNVRINNNFHSAAFRGQRYAVFRNYHRQWHDRTWWRSHYTRIVFVNGGWYYWNAGYWFPAWGYDPFVSYVYDGPIYAYNGLTPDRVIVDVQEQLARDGYYDGPIDGILGPMTREAIAAFQADNGLSVTSVIDEPTLATLGIA
jgi:putative peptidoglycan binding protein